MADAQLRAQDSTDQNDRHIWCMMLKFGKYFAFHQAFSPNDTIGRLCYGAEEARSVGSLDVKHCVLQSVVKLAACE